MNFYIDADKMIESGNDIITLSNDLKDALQALYSRIELITTSETEWVGNSAEAFVENVRTYKGSSINYASEIYKYGEYLVNSGNKMKNSINQSRR